MLLRNLAVKGLNNDFRRLQASKSGPKIPALAFADDCIIFSKAETKSISVIKNCLDDFCMTSGQALNHSKYALYFAPATSKYLRRQTKRILNVKSAKGQPNLNIWGCLLLIEELQSHSLMISFVRLMPKLMFGI